MTKTKTTKSGTKSKAKSGKKNPGGSNTLFSVQTTRTLLLLILAGTLFAYLPVLGNDFVWDDTVYIQQNPLIHSLNLPVIFSTYLTGIIIH